MREAYLLCNHCGLNLAEVMWLTKWERDVFLNSRHEELEREKAEMEKVRHK